MTITYQFSNTNNWLSLWNGSFSAEAVPAKPLEQFYPIPPINVPLLIEEPIIAIHASSFSAQENWKYAGSIYQKIQTGITVGGSADSYLSSHKFYLNQITICPLLQLDSSFALEIKIPYWIRDINLKVWQYTGPVMDSYINKFDSILEKLDEAA